MNDNLSRAQAAWEASWEHGPPDPDEMRDLSDDQLLEVIRNEPDWEDVPRNIAARLGPVWDERVRRAREILRGRSYFR